MSRLRLGVRLAARDLRRRATETLLLLHRARRRRDHADDRARSARPDRSAVRRDPAPHSRAGRRRSALPSARRARSRAADLAAARMRSPAGRRSHREAGRSRPPGRRSRADGIPGVAEVQGRDAAPRPSTGREVVSGRWVGPAAWWWSAPSPRRSASGWETASSSVARRVRVVGIAVSAALPPYPQLCTIGCILDRPDWFSAQPGLVWTTRAEAAALATAREPLVWFQYLKLHDPARRRRSPRRYGADGPPTGRPQLDPWQDIAGRQAEQLANERTAVVFGSTLLVDPRARDSRRAGRRPDERRGTPGGDAEGGRRQARGSSPGSCCVVPRDRSVGRCCRDWRPAGCSHRGS